MRKLLEKLIFLFIALLVMLSGMAIMPVQGAGTAAIQEIDCGDTYFVRTGDTLREIANLCDVTVEEILELNGFIDNPNLIYAGWVLDLPTDGDDEDEQTVAIPETGAATVSSHFYIVKAGDSLPYIAHRLDISEEDILTANPQLDDEPELITGQILLLPNAGDVPAAAVSPRVVEPGQHVTVVASGFEADSEVTVAGGPLGEQSRVLETFQTNSDGMLRRQITVPIQAERGNRWTFVVQDLQAADDDDTELLRASTNLVYVVDTTGPGESIVYNVRVNDTMSAIAVKFGVPIEAIMEANPQIENPSIINVGEDVLIPGPEEREDTEEDDPDEEETVDIPEAGGATVSSAFYIVKAGDSLEYISRRLDISLDDILTVNPQIDNDTELFTGQILLLPNAGDGPAAAVSPRVIEPGQMVTVVARGFEANSEVTVAGGPLGGESRVFETFEVSGDGMLRKQITIPMEAERGNRWTFVVQDAQAEDDDDTDALRARTNLVYIVDTTGPDDSITYTIRVNDTLSAIAAKFGVSMEEVLDANPQIADPAIINVGQDILIPGPEERDDTED